MTEKNTGGLAFPVTPPANEHGNSPSECRFPENGIIVRDYFVGKVMAGIIVRYPVMIQNLLNMDRGMILDADAMIEARDK